MNKDQKKARRKNIQKQVLARKQKAVSDRDLLDELEEDMEEDQTAESESESPDEEEDEVQKEWIEGYGYAGPTSFDELDAMEHAREQASQVSEVSWKVQDLVWNIIRHPLLTPQQKNKAIQAVGDGFEERVDDILSGEIQKDLDVLSIEAVLAHDARRTGLVEKAVDFIQKKTLSSSARNKLSGEQFALPEKRKYPIHDKAHVRNALARAAQQIKAGGEGAADARAALPKIRAAAKKFGIEMDTEKEKTGIIIEKDASGTWRWIGWYTNKWIDTDGEILADVAHKEYVGWLDQNPEMAPAFFSWHEPETVRKSAADFWMYENGFLTMSGPLTESEAESLMQVQKEIDLGMSHGTIVLKRDPANRKIILKYRTYEVSELPLENAANPFTSFDTVVKEAGMDKKAYLVKLFGADRAEKMLALTKEAEQTLTDVGVTSKEKTDEQTPATPATPAAPGTTTVVNNTPGIALDQAMIDQIAKAVGDKYGMTELSAYLSQLGDAAEKVPVLEELVKALAENQDDALAEKINPPASSFVWMQKNRASQSDKTKLMEGNEEDDKLKKQAPRLDPEEDWLAMQTGVTPVRLPS